MKKGTKLTISLLGVSSFLAFGLLSNIFNSKKTITPVLAEPEEDVLYFEDFSGDTLPLKWGGNKPIFDLIDGKALFNGSNPWKLIYFDPDEGERVSSNNYDISFDLHYNSSAESYFHIDGIDVTTPGNIYLALIEGGTYWRLGNYGSCDIFDNSGEDQGSNTIDPAVVAKMKATSVNVRFYILDDVIELFVEGKKIISVPLSAYGNNRYSSRRAITKGIIDGFAFDCRASAGEMTIDNFLVKEAKRNQPTYYYSDDVFSSNAAEVLPLSYANMFNDNFTVSARFTVNRTLVENSSIHAYPRIGLVMNQIIPGLQLSDPSNCINAQNYLDRNFATPWIGAIKHDTYSWNGVNGEYVECDYDDTTYVQTVSVWGNHISLTTDSGLDGEREKYTINTTFDEIGIPKGKLLSIVIGNGYTTATDVEYFGYENDFGVKVFANATRILKNNELILNAKTYGPASSDLVWYVDGVATDIHATSLNKSDLTVGTHTFAYGNETIKSEVVSVEVFENMITISADKTSIYPIDNVTFTAVTEGDFAGKTLNWQVNNNILEGKTGETLVLDNLQPGNYKVKCVCENISSNEVQITVKAPELTISSIKTMYKPSETAVVTTTRKGIAESDAIEWFVNGTKNAHTGISFELPLKDYATSGKVVIEASTVSGTKSNFLTLYVTGDIYAYISVDPNWRTIYQQEITDGMEFGSYEVLEDETGKFLHPTNNDIGDSGSFEPITVKASSWAMEYDLLVPATVKSYSGSYFAYPSAVGLDSKNPSDAVELAVSVSSWGFTTYVKTHASGINYDYGRYNTGVNLSYSGGIAKIGWNHIVFAMNGNMAAFYINGTMVYFAEIANVSSPSGFVMCMYPGSGGKIPLGFKNFTIKGAVEPAPDVASVIVSANKVAAQLGETISFNAVAFPYNAGVETIEWYVNGTKVEGANKLTYSFTPDQIGEYRVVCVVNGISSSEKVITIVSLNGDSDTTPSEPTKKGCGGSIIATSALISITAVVGFGLLLSKKRKER